MNRLLVISSLLLYGFSTALVAAGVLAAPKDNPIRWFDEKQTVSAYSAALLYTCALVSLFNFLIERLSALSTGLKRFWFMAIFGFFFLMADEFFAIHEGMDSLILYKLLGFKPTPLLNKFDAFVLVAYGLAGIYYLYAYREELKHIIGFYTYIFIGAFFSSLSILLDFGSDTAVKVYCEEGTKVIANTSFLNACLCAAIKYYNKFLPQRHRVDH